MLQASEFEFRHQTLVHPVIVGLAALTYLIDPEGIGWRLSKIVQLFIPRNAWFSVTLLFSLALELSKHACSGGLLG